MTEKMVYRFPDDDGKRQRAWVTDYRERESSACERVKKVLNERPWICEVTETVHNDCDDQCGVDMFVVVDPDIFKAIGEWGKDSLLAVQVKSSERKQRKFKTMHQSKIFNQKDEKHIFVLDGQDALDVIRADLMGQLIVLAGLTRSADEEDLLNYMERELYDRDIVQRFRENRELIVTTKWYKSRLK
jgi:hypothetical protein